MSSNVAVITRFKNGTRVKFTMPYKQFINTLIKDNDMRLDMWIESDTKTPHKTFYKVIGLRLDKVSGRIE
jgi:hypothetical protein